MAVEAALVDEVRRLEAELRDDGAPLVFENLAEVFAFLIARVRAEGVMPEDDAVEALARAAGLMQGDLRQIIGVLAPLGYTTACARLRKLARRKVCR
jgi:hypothetical protein